MPGLLLKNISKSFGEIAVLKNVSLQLATGELLVLLGSSGCGKSTLLRIIAGLETADTGEIFIGDKRVDRLRPKDRDVALVFQNYALYPHMTVSKNLEFPLKIARINRLDRRLRVQEVAEMLGLSDRLHTRPAQLSGGQRQRVALGRAIIRKPSLFLFDEPLSNLDTDLRVRMRRELVRLQKNLNTTTIHVTHDQEEALTMGDRIALLHDGELVQVGTPHELYHAPANVYVAQTLGHPKINLIKGKVEHGMLFPFGLQLPTSQVPDGPILIGIRPGDIQLRPSAGLVAQVASSEYHGGSYSATITFGEHQLTVSQIPQPLVSGSSVYFTVSVYSMFFFDPNSGKRLV